MSRRTHTGKIGKASSARLLCLCGWIVACQPPDDPTTEAYLVLELPGEVDAHELAIEPARLAGGAELWNGNLVLALPAGTGHVRLRLPSACPFDFDARRLGHGETAHRKLKPWIDVGPPRPQLGLNAAFEIQVEAGCPEAREGRISWRQIEGKPLSQLTTTKRGFHLSARTPQLTTLHPDPLPMGLVPISPDTQGRVVLEATFRAPSGHQIERLELSSLARSRGLPNVPLDASVLLGGDTWHFSSTPPEARARLSSGPGYSLFRPNVAGRWLLEDASGRRVSLLSARYEQVPLDCARAGCHAALGTHPAGRMSSVLARGMSGALGKGYDVECALACHSVGEPGLSDGGFFDVANELGVTLSRVEQYQDLPPALIRLANVGCLGCHGPGAIPEPAARWSILRSEVCGFCHDAPPRYGHAAAWRENRMSRADRHLANSGDPACASCHTTWGFLQMRGAAVTERAPPDEQRLGITCAACHAVHQDPSLDHLLRRVQRPAVADHLAVDRYPSSSVCLPCHAPDPGPESSPKHWPRASATAIWLGRGGFTEQGDALSGQAVHASAPDGCLSCHRGSRGNYQKGGNHAFRATDATCAECHAKLPEVADTASRARSLLRRLTRKTPSAWARALDRALESSESPTHALASQADTASPAGRAAYNLLLVLEDPAAGVHNPSYAELLLDQAERMLEDEAR